MNSWPGGRRHAMDQGAHERWNGVNYPGTRQLCVDCEEPTERCEEDVIYIEDHGPLCEQCYSAQKKRSRDRAHLS